MVPLLGGPRSSGTPVHWTAWTPGSYATAHCIVQYNTCTYSYATRTRFLPSVLTAACYLVLVQTYKPLSATYFTHYFRLVCGFIASNPHRLLTFQLMDYAIYLQPLSPSRTTLVLTASFQDNVGKPVPVCQAILNFAAARDDGGNNYSLQYAVHTCWLCWQQNWTDNSHSQRLSLTFFVLASC